MEKVLLNQRSPAQFPGLGSPLLGCPLKLVYSVMLRLRPFWVSRLKKSSRSNSLRMLNYSGGVGGSVRRGGALDGIGLQFESCQHLINRDRTKGPGKALKFYQY